MEKQKKIIEDIIATKIAIQNLTKVYEEHVNELLKLNPDVDKKIDAPLGSVGFRTIKKWDFSQDTKWTETDRTINIMKANLKEQEEMLKTENKANILEEKTSVVVSLNNE